MRNRLISIAFVVLSLGSAARADFEFSFTSADAGDGNERVTIYALNRGNTTGSKALASDVTLVDLSGPNLVVKFIGTRPDVTGTGAPDPYHSDRSFVNLLGDPSGGPGGTDNNPTAYNLVSTIPTLRQFNSHMPQFEVTGANLSGGVDATAAANGGRGAIIAVAVAPTGDLLCATGMVGGDMGAPESLATSLQRCPEPASFAILGAGLIVLGLRRRRT